VAVDAAGDLLIVDVNNNRIREVDPSGVITTVAGNGASGYSGDGGPATSARLAAPSGVVVDAAGDLFIADYLNSRVRKVDPSGVITTVAGNGVRGYSGDGGPATSAQLNSPAGVAMDAAGNLFIGDEINERVRKVDPSGVITTVAGNGDSGYSGDGGPATSARLYFPTGVAVDAAGNLFIADYANDRVREVSVATTLLISAPTTVTAGDTFSVTVTAAEADGTPDPEYRGTVTLSSTDPQWTGVFTHTFTPADAGTFTFTSVQLFTAGPQSLAATDGTLTGGAGLSVLAGAAAYLLLIGPADAQAGMAFTVTVTAYDAWGNVATGYLGRVTFASNDGAAVLPDDYAFTSDDAGSHTFSVTLNTPGPAQLNVTDTDDGTLTSTLALTVH
jgi:sugar lactone lactonase YvrE